MRISDWSSDVCSSDLGDGPFVRHAHDNGERACTRPRAHEADAHIAHDNGGEPGPDPGRVSRRPGAASHAHRSAWTTLLLESVRELGRASCRERVCPYG